MVRSGKSLGSAVEYGGESTGGSPKRRNSGLKFATQERTEEIFPYWRTEDSNRETFSSTVQGQTGKNNKVNKPCVSYFKSRLSFFFNTERELGHSFPWEIRHSAINGDMIISADSSARQDLAFPMSRVKS